MDNLATLLIQLISGAAGGNLGGALFKTLNLGTLGNSLAGLVGGGVGSQILNSLIGPGASMAATAVGGDPIGAKAARAGQKTTRAPTGILPAPSSA